MLGIKELNERLQCIVGVVVCGFCDDYVMKEERLARSQKLHSHRDTEVTAATEVT